MCFFRFSAFYSQSNFGPPVVWAAVFGFSMLVLKDEQNEQDFDRRFTQINADGEKRKLNFSHSGPEGTARRSGGGS
jgi:hypothetical protein